jgi:hypothetical protein
MATDKDFASGEWQTIEAAPFMAGLAVTYGDLSSKRAIADEAAATGNAITGAAGSPSEIVRSIAVRFAAGQRPTIGSIPNKPEEALTALVDGCKAAHALVKAKAPGEADAYARFLLDTAKAAAGGAREGGFIGVGIQKVSEREQMALAALALALGLPA